ncbi:MAG: protein kinase domain-containing protein [Planctomycetota bacterium]
MPQPTTRQLVDRAVEEDLLGPDVLFGTDAPAAPQGYELIERIGQGGGGIVYLARDTNLDRLAAIKFLTDAGPADLERFRREARFAAWLNNPSIVAVYGLGEINDRPYIAMQYLDGGNLGDARLELVDLVRVIREVAIALKHAHAEGIVHRDIKPENILLDGEGRAYLTDFGIARHIQGGLGETLSRQGQVMGTPGLMPPEQARGEMQAVDARSDIYALGATLYFKLTGRYPFEAGNVVDVLHAVIHDEPPLPRSFNASIPRKLEAIVVRCMQKAREDRYQRIEEVVGDLDHFLSGDQIGAESSAWFRRLVGNLETAPVPEPARDADSEESWTQGLEIVSEIAAWDANLYRTSGSLTTAFARLDGLRHRLDAILTARPDTAWARFYRGIVLFRCGQLHAALEEMERAIDRVRNLSSAYFELGRLYMALHLKEQHVARKHLTRTGVEHSLSSTRGRLEQAIMAFEEAKRLGGDLPPWIGDCIEAVQRLAESDYHGCVVICDRILIQEPDVEGIWKLRGDAQCFAGEEPFESYDRALEVRRSYFEALYGKAAAHLARGQFDEARRALERAREIHPAYVDALALLARTYLVEGRQESDTELLATGERLARQALEQDPCHYDAAVTLAEIHLVRTRVTGRDDGLVSAVEILQTAKDLPGCPNRVNLLTAQVRLEQARQANADADAARGQLESILAFCATEAEAVSESEAWMALCIWFLVLGLSFARALRRVPGA